MSNEYVRKKVEFHIIRITNLDVDTAEMVEAYIANKKVAMHHIQELHNEEKPGQRIQYILTTTRRLQEQHLLHLLKT